MVKHPVFNGLGERLFWSYANLSMLFFALSKNKPSYDRLCYMIRAKMYREFCEGSMKVHSMFIDQKMKLNLGRQCVYCGEDNLERYSIDHILPKIKGGKDTGDNLILVCGSCNSSKRDTDMLEWLDKKEWYVNPWVLRNYLKLVLEYCEEKGLMDKHRHELDYSTLPFNPDYLPLELPNLEELGFFEQQ